MIAEVRQSIWKNHWKNARDIGFKDSLNTLMNNHKRLYSYIDYMPEERDERKKIINYLQAKIVSMYGQG